MGPMIGLACYLTALRSCVMVRVGYKFKLMSNYIN